MVSKSWMLIISFFKKLSFKIKYGNSIIFNGLIKVLPNVKILNKNGKIIFAVKHLTYTNKIP